MRRLWRQGQPRPVSGQGAGERSALGTAWGSVGGRGGGRDGCACEMGWEEQQGRAQGEETPMIVRVVVRQRQRRTAAWRARARPWQQLGAVAEKSGGVCARGIDGRPRSAAQAAHGRLFGHGVCVNGQGAARTACALKWGGASAARGQAAGQRRSEARAARSSACARAEQRGEGQRGRERKEREREWREKRKSAV